MDRIAGKMGVRKFYAPIETFLSKRNCLRLACNWPNGTFATTKLSVNIYSFQCDSCTECHIFGYLEYYMLSFPLIKKKEY